MKIIVAIKQIPARDSPLRVSADGKRLDESGLTYEMNGPDAYALEAGLQLGERWAAEVAVLCAGPERVTKTIREALAKGAHRGIHVLTNEEQAVEPFWLAGTIADAAREERPDLVLTGLQSEDTGYGETGVIVAELLGYSHATLITEVELLEGQVRVRKELEDGWSQYVTVPLPAVLSIQSGLVKPRLATMLGIRQAKNKKIDVRVAGCNADASEGQTIERLFRPVRETAAQIFTGEARECAQRLIEKLRFEARVL